MRTLTNVDVFSYLFKLTDSAETADEIFVKKFPWYRPIVDNMSVKATEEIPTASMDYKINLNFNPKFFETLTEKQLIAVLTHELFHYTESHFVRAYNYQSVHGEVNSELMNIAMDMEINQQIKNLPDSAILPDKYNPPFPKNLMFEQYIPLLLERASKIEINVPSNSKSENDDPKNSVSSNADKSVEISSESSQTSDKDDPEKGSESEVKVNKKSDKSSSGKESKEGNKSSDDKDKDLEEKLHKLLKDQKLIDKIDTKITEQEAIKADVIKSEINKLIKRARNNSKNRGQGEGDDETEVRVRKTRLLDFREFLSNKISNIRVKGYEYTNTSRFRKIMGSRVLFYKYYDEVPDIKISAILDTSGSRSDEDINRSISQVYQYLLSLNEDTSSVLIDMYETDGRVQKKTRIRSITDIPKTFVGNGGTELERAFKAFDKKIKYDLVIIFTDGYADWDAIKKADGKYRNDILVVLDAPIDAEMLDCIPYKTVVCF